MVRGRDRLTGSITKSDATGNVIAHGAPIGRTHGTELADVNVLVTVALEHRDDHEAALNWLRDTSAFATTPITEPGLVRLLVNPAVATLRGIKALETASFLLDTTSIADHPRAHQSRPASKGRTPEYTSRRRLGRIRQRRRRCR